MKAMIWVCRFFEGALLFFVPVVIFYWILAMTDIQAMSPITNLLGQFLSPLLRFTRGFVNYKIHFNGDVIDSVPLFLSFIILFLSFLFFIAGRILTHLEDAVYKVQIKVKADDIRRHSEKTKNKFLEELAKNKVVYLVLKFRKKDSSFSYLYQEEDDPFSEGIFNNLINGAVEYSSHFSGKKWKQQENKGGNYKFLFYNVTDAIDYSFYINNKVQEINKDILDMSKKLHYKIACHSSYSEITAEKDFGIAERILELCGENEILASTLFKNKYNALKEETNIKFDSKGIYNMGEEQIEVFHLKTSV
jgi:hypothetical protein